MDATQTINSAVAEWFEGNFKESAKLTTKTSRLQDGRLSYSFSVVNDSGFDFDDFSFRIKVIDKSNNEEIGTATIKAGEWKRGEKKTFKSKLAIPPDVKSLSFVMYSNTLKYTISEEDRNNIDSVFDGMDDAMRDIGEAFGGLTGSGGVFGELFGTGGMPETGRTTTTKTTTTRSADGTTRTTTTTTTSRGSSGTVNAGSTRTVPNSSPARQAGGVSSYTQRKIQKKLDKMRLGKSGWTIVALGFGLLFLLAAVGATEAPVAAAYGVAGLIGLAAAAVIKLVNNSRAKRIRTYESKVNYKGNTYIDDLCAAVGRPYEKVADELQQMIVDGFFPGAYVDFKNRLLVMTKDGQPMESVEKSVAMGNRAKRKSGKDTSPQTLDDLITMTDDAELKSKLKKLRTVTKKIDARVEEVPELGKQVKEFREKYYPEVVRLTDAYNDKIADLARGTGDKPKEEVTTSADGAPVINSSPNYLEEQAADIKKQLISLIDSVTEASDNLLERLYEDDIMDITTDIQSLQTTLASKGLLDSDFDI